MAKNTKHRFKYRCIYKYKYKCKYKYIDLTNHGQAGAIIGNPQLALWHSFANEAPEDPNVRCFGKYINNYLIKCKMLIRPLTEGQGGCTGFASMECTLSLPISLR